MAWARGGGRGRAHIRAAVVVEMSSSSYVCMYECMYACYGAGARWTLDRNSGGGKQRPDPILLLQSSLRLQTHEGDSVSCSLVFCFIFVALEGRLRRSTVTLGSALWAMGSLVARRNSTAVRHTLFGGQGGPEA